MATRLLAGRAGYNLTLQLLNITNNSIPTDSIYYTREVGLLLAEVYKRAKNAELYSRTQLQ